MFNPLQEIKAGDLNRMGFTLRRIAVQALPDNTDTTVSWDTETEDTHGTFTAPGTTITIPAGGDGIWAVTFGIVTSSPATARSLIAILPSTGPWAGGARIRGTFGAGEDTCSVTGITPFSAGNTFTCLANVDMAGAANMTATLTAYRMTP